MIGKRIVLFSYGSGLASSMFSLHFTEDATDEAMTNLLSGATDLTQRLESRHKVSPGEFADTMKLREDTHHLGNNLKKGFIHTSFISMLIFNSN